MPGCYTTRMVHPVHNLKARVAAISIFASAAMAAAKLAVGIAIGSLAMISDALHSVIDMVATIITWAVVRVSDRPADDEHHYGHGKVEFYSQKKGPVQISGSYQLEKGENLIVFSSGFLFNWKETHKSDLGTFLKSQTLKTNDILSELFFQLKMEQDTPFLKRDATVAMMEVKRHGIHQV